MHAQNFTNSQEASSSFTNAKFRESPDNQSQGSETLGIPMAKRAPSPTIDDRPRQAVLAFMKKRGLTVNGWTSKAGVSEGALRHFLKEPGRTLGFRILEKLADAENVPVAAVIGGEEAHTPPRALESESFALIPEIAVQAGMGIGGLQEVETFGSDTVRDTWGLPRDFIREARMQPEDLRILPLKGDSMAPTLLGTDRAIVNVADRVPSPPGIFAIWDGYGVIMKRVEIVPKTRPPRLRIISDNPLHKPYEIEGDEHTILGRLKGLIRLF
jgi:phage repressor protein C with HTH and peptisase S24 domain